MFISAAHFATPSSKSLLLVKGNARFAFTNIKVAHSENSILQSESSSRSNQKGLLFTQKDEQKLVSFQKFRALFYEVDQLFSKETLIPVSHLLGIQRFVGEN